MVDLIVVAVVAVLDALVKGLVVHVVYIVVILAVCNFVITVRRNELLLGRQWIAHQL